MKKHLKRYLKPCVILAGLALMLFFGAKAAQLGMNKPIMSEITADMTVQAVGVAKADFEKARTVWNNQFARKGFFALVGMFLMLIGLVPKKKLWIPKVLFSSGLVALIIHHLLADGKIADIASKGFEISIFWIIAAFIVKGTGMWCTIWRWRVLLLGQGFKIPLRHLIESFLIGRFIGSFAPGTSGLDGYRAYDISRYTGKVARSISVIFVEKLIGFFVLGTLLLIAVPVGQELFAQKNVNSMALVMMALVFLGMMMASLVVLFQPRLLSWFLDRFIPKNSPVRKPFDKAIKAVTAYEKRKLYLAKATAIGFGVHCCTIGMYFCTARAIGVFPPSGDLFVTSALMIGATILPLSIAGIGMREGVFAFFLNPAAAIFAFGGYLVGEIISLFGGPVWLARRGNYYEVMKAQREAINKNVDDDDDEKEETQIPEEKKKEQAGPLPSIKDYVLTGAAAGLVGGLCVGMADAAKLWTMSFDLSLPGYAALIYGPLLAIFGAFSGGAMAILGRIVQKPASPRVHQATFISGAWFFLFVMAMGAKFLHRDIFGEKVAMKSGQMIGSLLGLAAVTILVIVIVCVIMRKVFSGDRDRFMKARFGIAFYGVITSILVVLWLAGGSSSAGQLGPLPQDADQMPNVLLVMNDTHRADYVGAYGNKENLTPNLDAMAKEGIVYQNAFAQSSWTRPSVATILTGRYASSHTAMMKTSVLPDEITTLAEVMSGGGYETMGMVTNYNLTPFFNFGQGFSDYRYLSPNLPLGATDSQSKLFFIEVYKQVAARFRGKKETPEDYYVIGEKVTEQALARLDERNKDRPFFMFLSYMDVHDPYFRHPFDGYGISHRSNPNPTEDMIPEMKELYKGEVKYWDQCFGDLINGLKERKLYDNTLILVVSDHGEEFGEHGDFWHGTTLYDEQVKVMFIAKHAEDAGFEPAVVPTWINLVDTAPLIIDSVGLKIPKEMQGKASAKNAPVFAEEDHQGNILTSVRYKNEGEEIKLIKANEGNPRGVEPLELYKINKDPGELNNVANADSSIIKDAMKKLNQLSAAAKVGAAKALSGELSAEDKAQLNKLGYMEEGEDKDSPKTDSKDTDTQIPDTASSSDDSLK